MKIVMATGGSGGHIFPALSTALKLRSQGHRVVFIGTPGQGDEKLKASGFESVPLCAKGLSFKSFRSFLFAVSCMIKSFFESCRFLKHFKPDAVAGFGGYGAFSAVVAARFLGYPAVIHEQNVVPGKANRILSKIVNKIAVSFQKSEKYFNAKKVVVTGCPCHIVVPSLERKECMAKFNLLPGRLTMLVLGGSQGSHAVNGKFLEAAVLLKQELDFQVIHVAGKKDCPDTRESYKNFGINASVFDFLSEIGLAYKAADVVISRAGAATLSELVLFRLPAILIPYPFAGGHQKENADVLGEAGLARILEEKDLTAQRLKDAVLSLLTDKNIREKAAAYAKNFFISDADDRLAKEIVSLAC
ncbi:MAG TPA: undecaprenyldiphospho-muramoylpentapeptide beta-N-acetylglucosaminyltransferase [Candidatus Omnitrophota bacterium]|nr:undecaprenyldiphospho-muramoylpentapeptide beta-N-acetylglucosaminyltransferase [Candidatus Omnitrophota bacterium]HPD85104.1 undecaprenyldiphospho-muramoylpentapeptide beta-N-acetylglucosaminyltransferase [Candidatus Omnitrophota bacterium]HRZ03962.1 undecaprenyldiphospho-muramoylpentapeptide beta-N-acetylglucosaminyltransferase [Candidatus Omnitrophota bacterium]